MVVGASFYNSLNLNDAASDYMGKMHEELTQELVEFIAAQKLFFVCTAPLNSEGHVNISPKGMDSLRIIDGRAVAYLDVTGSGVEITTRR